MGNEVSLQTIAHEENVKKCPECGSTEIGYRDGEAYCMKCGLIFD
ncbi:MAG: TFIIB-type zinc ribbon-containing protein [Nanoarchaeota archaeon]